MRSILLIGLAAVLAGCASGDEKDGSSDRSTPEAEKYKVKNVLAGNRLELEGGEEVVLAGIITPEPGDPFFEETRLQVERFVTGRDVFVYVRFFGAKDSKGRRCVHVEAPASALKVNTLVNTELLQAGLGRIDFKTLPSGFEKFYEEREDAARAAKTGIWSIPR